MSDADQQALVQKLLGEFTTKASRLFNSPYTVVSLHTDRSLTISQYAASVEQILRAHDVPTDANQPLPLMEALVENNDTSARPKLKTLADSYGAITTDLLNAHVPPQLSDLHLQLIQGFDSLHRATVSVTSYETDPLGVMGAISTFQPAANEVVTALKGMATVILSGGEPADGTPGAMIVSVARSTETQ